MLFFLGVLISFSAFAQVKKKDILMGANAGFHFWNEQRSSFSQLNSNLNPNFQWAYADKRTLGINFNFGWSQSVSGSTTQNSFSISPSLQLTQWHPIKDRLGWLLQQYAGFGIVDHSVRGTSINNFTDYQFFGGVTPALYYVVGTREQWILTASLGGFNIAHGWTKQTNQENQRRTSVGLSIFQSFQFGFMYKINQSKM